MSNFKQKVIEIIKLVPYGTVASYGQIALMAGVPRAARQVGWILNRSQEDHKLPWWRIINNGGRISIKGAEMTPMDQKELLENENILVADDFSIDIEAYRWRPTADFIKGLQLDGKYLDQLVTKYNL